MKKYTLEELTKISVDKFECDMKQEDTKRMLKNGFENAYCLLFCIQRDFAFLEKDKITVKEYLDWKGGL